MQNLSLEYWYNNSKTSAKKFVLIKLQSCIGNWPFKVALSSKFFHSIFITPFHGYFWLFLPVLWFLFFPHHNFSNWKNWRFKQLIIFTIFIEISSETTSHVEECSEGSTLEFSLGTQFSVPTSFLYGWYLPRICCQVRIKRENQLIFSRSTIFTPHL